MAARRRGARPRAAMAPHDRSELVQSGSDERATALLSLGAFLRASGYRFVTATPATHR